jgi:hypothetical protein
VEARAPGPIPASKSRLPLAPGGTASDRFNWRLPFPVKIIPQVRRLAKGLRTATWAQLRRHQQKPVFSQNPGFCLAPLDSSQELTESKASGILY